MSMQHDSHARFYQFRQADIFDKPEQNIRDGHGPQIQRGHATAVGPAPAPVREESVADSVDGDEEEMTEQVQHYLTHDGHSWAGWSACQSCTRGKRCCTPWSRVRAVWCWEVTLGRAGRETRRSS